MDNQRKEHIMSLLNKSIMQEKIDLGHLHMMFSERGFTHPSVQQYFAKYGLRLSAPEFKAIVSEMGTALEAKRKEVEQAEQAKEAEKAPSFQELMKKEGANLITNNKDLLSDVKKEDNKNDVVTEDYTKDGSGAYFTTGPVEDEPAAEEIVLPSKGRFYRGVIADKEGKILVRPMTLKEETIFTNKRLLKNGQAIDMVLRNCIKTPNINTSELLSSDRVFLLFFLRAISYGTRYTIKTKCPNCGTDNDDTLDIMKLEIKNPPSALTDPFDITLPKSNIHMQMRLSRGKDESESLKMNAINGSESNENMIERMISLIVSMEDISPDKYKSKLTNLIAGDIAHIRQTMQVIDFGYKVDKENNCSSCNSRYQLTLTINENFFRSE